MTIISRYIFREFMRMTAVCIIGFLALFIAIDFVEAANELLKHQATTAEIFRYYLYRIPQTFFMISPVAVLVGVLITVSLRARANEFTAMFSVGVSPLRAFAPLAIGCALVSALSLGTSEILMPHANRKAREIARLRIRPGKVAAQFSMNRYWIRGENAFLSAQVIDSANRALNGFQYIEIDRDFRPVRRIDAEEAVILPGGAWRLREGRERGFDADLKPVPFREKEFAFPETIQGFLDGETAPGEMTYKQLSGYVRESKARGYEIKRYEVDLHAKLAYPLLNVIVGLLAIPVALRAPRAGGAWRSIGAGLLIGFFCWMALSASLSLGRKGLMPPMAAAWLPDLLFASAGLLLFRRKPS
ncbi:MAG: LPS export ABC transporter permease LptG [Deltaproteobacteria bacterium]|nr:LPS export ABC transporter permease LptG [Deltaproteobacteria bacterium]